MKRKAPTLFTLIILVVIASLSLSACSSNNRGAGDNKSLLVMEWAGYELPEYWAPFAEQHPDVKVDFTFFADDAEGFAKAQNAEELDLMHPCANYFDLFVSNGLVQPIDTSRLTHWKDIYPELAEIATFDGKVYFIPWDWGYEAIAVLPEKVQTLPTSWKDLWNPEYAGHLSIFDAGENAFLLTALSLGYDPYNTTPEQEEEIKQKLIELKPNLMMYWSDFTELANLMANGDIWVAGNAWNETYYSLLGEGVNVEYVMPEEGAIGWMCGFGISSKTKNLDLVYDYLNAVMAPETNGQMAADLAYGPGNREAVKMIDPEVVTLLQLDNPDILKDVLFMRPLSEEQHQRFTDLWTEVKAAP